MLVILKQIMDPHVAVEIHSFLPEIGNIVTCGRLGRGIVVRDRLRPDIGETRIHMFKRLRVVLDFRDAYALVDVSQPKVDLRCEEHLDVVDLWLSGIEVIRIVARWCVLLKVTIVTGVPIRDDVMT